MLSANREEQHEDNSHLFLGHIDAPSSLNRNSKPWIAKVSMLNVIIDCRVDSGADVSIIPQNLYSKHFSHIMLRQPVVNIKCADFSNLDIVGMFEATLTYKNRSVKESIYVARRGAVLLSRHASSELGLLKFLAVNSVSTSSPENMYPSLFKGLGKMKTSYSIRLKEEATPYAVPYPRRISLPLMPRVKAELERLCELDVITPVTEPTVWCAPVVVVPKKNDQVRICVDLTKLNEAVLRERHMLPSVDHSLGQIAGAKYFSKLDANSGFHQIPLTESSRSLTTFITPFGRFMYKRLPFGISPDQNSFNVKYLEFWKACQSYV